MDEASVVQVLKALGSHKIKTGSGKVTASCPFAPWLHNDGVDNNPSFSMTINPGGPSKFYCFCCKSAGKKALSLLYAFKDCTGTWRSDLHDLITKQEGGSTFERYRRLPNFEAARRRSFHHQAVGHTSWQVAGYEGTFDLDNYKDTLAFLPRYAMTRGIDGTQAKKWRIGYDQDRQRLFLAVFDETGKMVGYSGRAISKDQSPKYLHAENFRRDKYLYGEQFIDKAVRVGFVMEGFMDVLNLDRLGWVNCLACLGTAVSETHIEKLKRWFDRIVILPHNDPKPDNPQKDAPGFEMAEGLARRLREAGVQVAIGPVVHGKKDPGEWTPAEAELVKRRLQGFIDARGSDSGEAASEAGEAGKTQE